jgi:hypothetical protein
MHEQPKRDPSSWKLQLKSDIIEGTCEQCADDRRKPDYKLAEVRAVEKHRFESS